MKIVYVILLVSSCFLSRSTVPRDCVCNDRQLWGRVKVVSYNATFKVKVVKYNAFLDVQRVDYAADKCGEWQFVDFGEDFTVQFVDFGEDLTVQYVDYNPGIH